MVQNGKGGVYGIHPPRTVGCSGGKVVCAVVQVWQVAGVRVRWCRVVAGRRAKRLQVATVEKAETRRQRKEPSSAEWQAAFQVWCRWW